MKQRHRPLRARVVLQLAAGLALLGSAVGLAFSNNSSTGSTPEPSPIQLGVQQDAGTGANVNSIYRLKIPRLSLDAPIVSVHIEDNGVLGVPADPSEIGWWADGPVPGTERGTSILAGHVNTADRGPGALKDIEQLEQGDQLIVEGWGEAVTFEVDLVVRFARGDVPSGAFDQRLSGRLAIVSCSDLDEETGQYRDNLFVYAKRVDAS